MMKIHRLLFVLPCLLGILCSDAAGENTSRSGPEPEGAIMKKEIITPDTVAKPAAPYASVVKVTAPGSLVFVSGVVSSDIDGNIIH